MAQETFIYNGDKIPIGGEIGQILTKVSGPNYYCAWRNLPAAYLDESGVSAGTYGTNRYVPQITVNASGIVTNAVNVAIDAPTVTGSGATGTWGINITGNASTAISLASGATISLSGDASGTSPVFNGTSNVTVSTTLANTGVSAGIYNNSATITYPFTVDAKGRITSFSSGITIAPAFSSITSKPTTFSGYGIADSSANLAAVITDETGTGRLVFATSPTFSGVPLAPTAAVDTNTTQLATTAYVIGQGYLKTTTASGIYAPLASPVLTGTPIAPTAAVDTNTTQIATTAYVIGQSYLKTSTASGLYAPLVSPVLTGTPTVPTAAADTNTTQIASTAYVVGQGYLKTTTASGIYAPIASPALTGVPTVPTAAADTNTTQIASTAFVVGQASSTTPVMNGVAAIGTSLKYARADHVHASDTSKANLASPIFTGVPAAPTAAVDTNTTQIATTAYVIGQGYLKTATASGIYAPLISPALTGIPTSTTAAVDTNTTQIATTAYVIAQGYLKTSTASSTYAPLASPALTGVPTAPTASGGTSTTQIATTAFVTDGLYDDGTY